MIQRLVYILTIAMLPLFSACESLQADSVDAFMPEGRPNIILIMADDIRADNFGSHGSTYFTTPHLDQLARTGTRFTHCHANPLCTPSRVKIMTGRSNIRNYVDFGVLDPDEITFAPILKQAGYTTVIAGKWQLHYLNKGTHPKDAHFDQWSLWNTPLTKRPRYWKPSIEQNGKIVPIDPETAYGPDIHVAFINRFIKENQNKPFFVYYPMMLPHFPFDPTPDSKNLKNKNKNENYRDMVQYMDQCVGRIVSTLDELQLREKTIILFTSDNGTDPDITYSFNNQTRRGEKSFPTLGGTHVPLIVNMPGTVPVQTRDDLIDFSDFLPTLTDLAKTQAPDHIKLDGRSFLPQLLGQKGDPRQSIFIYYYARPHTKNQRSMGAREYRYALNHRYKLYATQKFYDMHNDPHEKSPLNLKTLTPAQQQAYKTLRETIESMPSRPEKIRPYK